MTSVLKAVSPSVRRGPDDGDYARLQGTLARDLARMAARLASGSVSPREWYDLFSNRLLAGHTDSVVLGRWLAGDDSPASDVDALVARAWVDAESEWLLPFLRDVEDGRYLEAEDALSVRSRMYAGKLRGSANRAFLENSRQQYDWEWRLGAVERHCSDCPVLSAMSPWRRDELGYVPGEGGTPCLTNCKCSLVRADGVRGFAPVPLSYVAD